MKPILFNTDMVRAILDGRKTVTRRVVKNADRYWGFEEMEMNPAMTKVRKDGTEYAFDMQGLYAVFLDDDGLNPFPMVKVPYSPGDILYVRETWAGISDWANVDPSVGIPDGYIYKADWRGAEHPKWHPSIHMPRKAARIFLLVTNVRVERVGEILPCDIQKEGCPYSYSGFCEEDAPDWEGWMKSTWDRTIKPADRAIYGWDANPWVWVIEFEKISRGEVEDSDK